MVQAGLVRRTLRNNRVVRLEAVPETLTARDLRLVWSTAAFPIETTPADPAPTGRSTAEAEALRDELAATRAELARVRLQLEMFRAWAKRMPGLDTSDDDLPPTPTARSTGAILTNAPSRNDAAPASRLRCQYVHPDNHPDPERRGQPCELQVWDGSRQWCWHHDPTPIGRRRAPVRRLTSAA